MRHDTRNAQKDAETITEFLRREYPNMAVSKISLRAKYDLPVTHSSLVFELMRNMGCQVEGQTITAIFEEQKTSASL